jgi:tetratricopeptide (TPR) repeat protein
MEHTADILKKVIPAVVAVAMIGWLLIRSLKRSDEPWRLIGKWILTALLAAFMFWKVIPMTNPATRGSGAFAGIAVAAFCGLALMVIWRQNLAGLFARPFESLFDGGARDTEARPLYSTAQALRNRGHYNEAIAEIRRQLAKFPKDFIGQRLLAEIQAENLNDIPGAEVTIRRLCSQRGQPPAGIALALNALADWHLKFAQDRDAARRALETIAEMLPGSEWAARAAQRIAHLADTEFLIGTHDRKRIALSPAQAKQKSQTFRLGSKEENSGSGRGSMDQL